MSPPWPPPPDLESLKELFAAADVEGLIADDCPIDEYDPEAKLFFNLTKGWKTADFTSERILPVLTKLFEEQFPNQRPGGLEKQKQLAQEIARFFGPEAQPQVRSTTN